MKLSILICTIPSRAEMFNRLQGHLLLQLNIEREVEILSDDDLLLSIGAKRNNLINKAKGEFVVFIDDDDWVSSEYVGLLLSAIKSNPNADCVGIQGIITTNGVNEKQWYISKDYQTWHEKDDIYYRTPNHISPVRRTIALKHGFPDWNFSEDNLYSKMIYPHLKTEVKVTENIYHYRYIQK